MYKILFTPKIKWLSDFGSFTGLKDYEIKLGD